jgi:hypothetical protein
MRRIADVREHAQLVNSTAKVTTATNAPYQLPATVQARSKTPVPTAVTTVQAAEQHKLIASVRAIKCRELIIVWVTRVTNAKRIAQIAMAISHRLCAQVVVKTPVIANAVTTTRLMIMAKLAVQHRRSILACSSDWQMAHGVRRRIVLTVVWRITQAAALPRPIATIVSRIHASAKATTSMCAATRPQVTIGRLRIAPTVVTMVTATSVHPTRSVVQRD